MSYNQKLAKFLYIYLCFRRFYFIILNLVFGWGNQVACQDQSDEDGTDDVDDQQAEHDAMLIEYAGEIIPSLAKIVPGVQFAPYFAGILSTFMPKMVFILYIYIYIYIFW